MIAGEDHSSRHERPGRAVEWIGRSRFSRTVFGLSSGDTIAVQVGQDSGSTKEVYGTNQETDLTIYKVG